MFKNIAAVNINVSSAILINRAEFDNVTKAQQLLR